MLTTFVIPQCIHFAAYNNYYSLMELMEY